MDRVPIMTWHTPSRSTSSVPATMLYDTPDDGGSEVECTCQGWCIYTEAKRRKGPRTCVHVQALAGEIARWRARVVASRTKASDGSGAVVLVYADGTVTCSCADWQGQRSSVPRCRICTHTVLVRRPGFTAAPDPTRTALGGTIMPAPDGILISWPAPPFNASTVHTVYLTVLGSPGCTCGGNVGRWCRHLKAQESTMRAYVAAPFGDQHWDGIIRLVTQARDRGQGLWRSPDDPPVPTRPPPAPTPPRRNQRAPRKLRLPEE